MKIMEKENVFAVQSNSSDPLNRIMDRTVDIRRRKVGAILGALTGLIYGYISLYINVLMLPGIPLYQNPPGRFVSLLLIILAGCLIGLITAWSEEAIIGVLISAFIGAVVVSIQGLAADNWSAPSFMLLFLYLFLPRVVMFLPVSGLLRWASSKWETQEDFWVYEIRKKGLSIGILFGLTALFAYLSIFPSEVRTSFTLMQALMQQGMQASETSELPQALQAVPGFIENAHGNYSMEWNINPDLLAVQRPVVGMDVTETFVIIHFENGYQFGCVFTPPYSQPSCYTY